MNAPNKHHKLLGQMLLDQGALSGDQLNIALLEQNREHQPLGRLLVHMGFISAHILKEALAEKLGTSSIDLSRITVDATALNLIPVHLAKRHRLMPLDYLPEQQCLTLAMADIHDLVALDQVRHQLDSNIHLIPLLASEPEIDNAIDRYYGHELSIDGILQEIETGELDWHSLNHQGSTYHHPVIRLIDALLLDAVKREASDIHFEPEAGFLRIRYRLDGLLHQIRALHSSYWPAMAVRLKVISNMNIAETRAPQDGHLTLTVSGRPVDFRVASHPTLHGENIVLRILDRQKSIVPLEQLGLEPSNLGQLQRMMARPEGVILVTGPTGSGKTTTLYSALSHINTEHVHIMTLEDPVEFPLPRVRQTSVGEAAKLDFASGIRSMMRQDPDVILVGEIRDTPTAEMAFRAAMTGHQVYATLHSNSALGAIPRLVDIGITPDILAGNIIGIVAQRLVRRLCEHCKQLVTATQEEARLLGIWGHQEPPHLYQPVGCEHCHNLGYKGRLAIMELLRLDQELDDMIVRQRPRKELLAHATARGFRSLADDGIKQVLAGATSLAELSRVVDLTDRM